MPGTRPIRRTIICALAVGLCASTAAAQPSSGDGSLQKLIAQIRAAEDVSSAAEIYARARAIDDTSADLYRAYMRKALLLGYPRIAFYPASELIRLDSDDPMALSVIGYYHALRGNLVLAAPSVISALERAPTDVTALHNAGHIIAWYENMPLQPNLPDPIRQTIGKNRKIWGSKPQFARTFKASAPVLKQRTDRINKLREQLDTHEETSDEVTARAKRLQGAYRANAAGLAGCERGIIATQDDMDKLRFDTDLTGYKRLKRQRELDRQMAAFKKRQGELNREKGKIASKLEATLKELGSARTAVDDTRESLQEEESQMPQFKWSPPTVDGRVVADAEPDGKPTVVVTKHVISGSSQTDPETAIKLAKLLIQNGRIDKARESLQELLASRPPREIADEARKLLRQIKDEKGPSSDTPDKRDPAKTTDSGPLPDDPGPVRPAGDPEDALKMARMLIRNNSGDRAKLILRSLIVDHPNTGAAIEAKVLLKGLEALQP